MIIVVGSSSRLAIFRLLISCGAHDDRGTLLPLHRAALVRHHHARCHQVQCVPSGRLCCGDLLGGTCRCGDDVLSRVPHAFQEVALTPQSCDRPERDLGDPSKSLVVASCCAEFSLTRRQSTALAAGYNPSPCFTPPALPAAVLLAPLVQLCVELVGGQVILVFLVHDYNVAAAVNLRNE